MSTAGGSGEATDGWTVIVPVKSLDRAKSRLSPALGARARRDLVLAMAADVVSVCSAAPRVVSVHVVSSDPAVATLAHRMGARFVHEPGPSATDPGADPLNAAVTAAVAAVPGPVAVVAADLPELTADQFAELLTAAAGHEHSTVPDHRGAGTAMAFWTGPPAPRVSRFGPASALRFRVDGGAVPLGAPTAATRDVDTPDDLAELRQRSVGPATAGVLRQAATAAAARSRDVSATMVP